MGDRELYFYQAGWEACSGLHSFGPAIRDHYLIHYIVKGKGRYKVGNEEYLVQQGEGFLIYPDTITFYQADQDDPWEYYWIGIGGKEVQETLARCLIDKEHPVFRYDKDDRLQQVLHQLYLATRQYNVNEYEQKGYAYLFLATLTSYQEIGSTSHHEYVGKAIKFIESNYSYDMTIGQIANYVGIERTYLFRLFKKMLHQSPQEYVIQFRLKKASEMLITSHTGITEVAYSCGFREVGYFSRCFKNYYKVSPSQYRKRNLIVQSDAYDNA